MMGNIMSHLPDKLIEGIIGGGLAIFAFFSKRTLHEYDQRIQKTEAKQDKILDALTTVEKQVIRIATKLEDLNK